MGGFVWGGGGGEGGRGGGVGGEGVCIYWAGDSIVCLKATVYL